MSHTEDTAPAPAQRGRLLARTFSLIGLGLSVILLLILAGAAYAGYQAGLAQRESQWRATQAADLQLQYDLGLADLAAGRHEVAIARFEYILQLDPNYRDAAQKLAESRAALQVTATPSPLPTETLVPTATPTPVVTETRAAADLFAQAQEAYAAGDWDAVIDLLTRLHTVDSAYEAVQVDGMLYVALRNRGIARILSDEMEAGMFDLDQAEAFGPLDQEALNYRAWARLYLAAQSYWGVNWQQAMLILQDLYLIAPYFRDTSTRLYQATVNYADQLMAADDYCGAAEHYQSALNLVPSDPLAQKLTAAQEACAMTPTPDPAAESPTEEPTAAPP